VRPRRCTACIIFAVRIVVRSENERRVLADEDEAVPFVEAGIAGEYVQRVQPSGTPIAHAGPPSSPLRLSNLRELRSKVQGGSP
jgi:hypothetical protein